MRRSCLSSVPAAMLMMALAAPLNAESSNPSSGMDAAAWRADLAQLASEIRRIHPEPFAMVAEASFDSAVQALNTRIPDLDDHEVAAEFLRIVAMVRDGHTGVRALMPQVGFASYFPVRTYAYLDEGLGIIAAATEHADIVGGRVVEIGSMSAEDAVSTLMPYAGGDNEFSSLDRIPFLLMVPKLLQAVGVNDDPEKLRLVVETMKNGKPHRKTVMVAPVASEGRPQWLFRHAGLPVEAGATLHDDATTPLPLHLRDEDKAWWFAHDSKRRLVYFQLRRIEGAERDVTFADFVQTMFSFVDSVDARYMVIDLRHNGGGNNTIVQPLIHELIKREDGVNQEGRLFTITGRATFSAAMNTVNWLEEHTHTTFVGEPTGARVNHFGDAESIRLEHSGLPVFISAWRWQARLPWDDRRYVTPQIAAPPSLTMDRANADPALEMIYRALAAPPIEPALRAHALAGEFDQARMLMETRNEQFPNPWGNPVEAAVTELTIQMFSEGHHRAAFRLQMTNAEVHPESPRVWTTLARGYMAMGDMEQAQESIGKALAAEPGYRPALRLKETLARQGAAPPEVHSH